MKVEFLKSLKKYESSDMLVKNPSLLFVVPGVWGGGAGVGEATNVTCSCPEGEGIAEGWGRAGRTFSERGPNSGYLQLCGPCGPSHRLNPAFVALAAGDKIQTNERG